MRRGPMSMDEIISSMEQDIANQKEEGTFGLGFEELGKGNFMITGIKEGNVDMLLPKSYNSGNVVRIGENAFENCNIRTVVIPKGIKIIDTGAFKGCAELIMVDIPASVYLIEKGAFEGCKNLKCIFVANKKVAKLAKKAASSLSSYVKVKKPTDGTSGLKFVLMKDDTYVLESGRRTDIADVIIPEYFAGKKVSTIWNGAFAYCSNLNRIIIPKTVTSIKNDVFLGCNNLSCIYASSNATAELVKKVVPKDFSGTILSKSPKKL